MSKVTFSGLWIVLVPCLVLLSVAACSAKQFPPLSQEPARTELRRLKIAYDEKTFFDRIKHGDTASVKLFLDAGMNPETRGEYNSTPLIWATDFGRVDIVRLLLDRGVDVHATDEFGATALFKAAFHAHPEVAQELIEAGADPNVGPKNSGYTPLMIAVLNTAEKEEFSKQLEVIKLLLKAGADPNAKSNENTTALSLARDDKRDDIIQLLKQAGAKQ